MFAFFRKKLSDDSRSETYVRAGSMPGKEMASPVQGQAYGFWRITLYVVIFYCLAVLLVAVSRWNDGSHAVVQAFGIPIGSGIAIAVLGGFLGFLFGMPRFFGGTTAKSSADTTSDAQGGDAGTGRAETDTSAEKNSWANNNLVEVSDWLTKIVVGIGLVKIVDIITWVGSAGTVIGLAAGYPKVPILIGGTEFYPLPQTLGVTTILLGFCLGFLVTYIYSRTFISQLFASTYSRIASDLQLEVQQMRETQLSQNKEVMNAKQMVQSLAKTTGGPAQVLAALYDSQPDGFEEAISLGEDLVQQPKHSNDPLLWRYIACAYGQKFGYLKRNGGKPRALTNAADKAFNAASRAIECSDKEKRNLAAFWNRNDSHFTAGENDLTPFWDDEEQRVRFAALFDYPL